MLTDIAYAMGQSGAPQGQGGGFMGLMPLMIIFVIFYFLLIRPQQKKTKEHQGMIDSLKEGDQVVTNGGIYGRLTKIEESTVVVEIADRVRIKVSRPSISGLTQDAPVVTNNKNDKKDKKSKNS